MAHESQQDRSSGETVSESGPGDRRHFLKAAGALSAAGAVAAMAAAASPASAASPAAAGPRTGSGLDDLPRPAVIGHRGASGYRPEHTLASYDLALRLGADIIEQDLVPTKDGRLVCRHENDITATTDVAEHPEFAGRKTTKTIDGTPLTGWFTEDFTLSELKTLRAVERIPGTRQRNTLYNGRDTVPTLEEAVALARRQSKALGRRVWLHIETKHPSYFRSIGLGLESRLAKALKSAGLAGRRSPALIQSFEPGSLQRMDELVGNPLVQLYGAATAKPYDFIVSGDPRTYGDLAKPAGLAWVAEYAEGIGPSTDMIIPRAADGTTGTPTTLVADAHRARLIVHPYTLRNENTFLPVNFRRGTAPNDYGNAFGWYAMLYAQQIDGVFSDNPDTAYAARADFWKERG
jgi:glycerophosphoryl diester phosphodiesterase